MALWTPAQRTVRLWLDAADTGTLFDATSGGSQPASGAGVARWQDKSGNSLHVVQSTVAERPLYDSAGFGEKGSLYFDGGDSLTNTTTGLTSGTYSGSLNFYWVATREASGGGTIINDRQSTLLCPSQWVQDAFGSFIYSDGANSSSNVQISGTAYARLSTLGGVVSHHHVSGARDLIWLNGSSETTTTGTGSSITGTAGFSVGRRTAAVPIRWTGKICEVIAIASSQTTLERQTIEGYLAWKWGLQGSLPVGHPYKNAPPTRPGNPEAVHFFFGGF
jgi:hypothetical protein